MKTKSQGGRFKEGRKAREEKGKITGIRSGQNQETKEKGPKRKIDLAKASYARNSQA